jgi:hypothetical protein
LVDERLATFSRDLDLLIGELSGKHIQIRRPDKPDGLFQISLTSVSVLALASEIPADTAFGEFLDKVFDLFWQVLEEDLERVRAFVDGPMRSRQRALYDDLEAELRTELYLAPLADAVIRARGQADIALDMVRDWFELPTPSGRLVLTVNELVDISLEAVRRLHPDFHPELVAPRFDGIPPFQGALNLFSDIFFVLFENVHAHSGEVSPRIEVSCVSNEGSLTVRVENGVRPDIAEARRVSVEAARAKMRSGAYQSEVSREGGTGFPKLARLIRYRDSDANFDFGVDLDRKRFWLEFTLATRILNDQQPDGQGLDEHSSR